MKNPKSPKSPALKVQSPATAKTETKPSKAENEQTMKRVSWVRMIQNQNLTIGVGFLDGALIEVYNDAGRSETASLFKPISLKESAARLLRISITAETLELSHDEDDAAMQKWLGMIEAAVPATWSFEVDEDNKKWIAKFEESGSDVNALINECLRLHLADKKAA